MITTNCRDRNRTMNTIERATERYILLSKSVYGNQELKDYMRDRSPAFRDAIYRQLVKWDCEKDVPIALLKVAPKERREGRMTLQQLQAHLRLRQSGWDSKTDKAMQRAVRVHVNGGSLDEVLDVFDEVIREG